MKARSMSAARLTALMLLAGCGWLWSGVEHARAVDYEAGPLRISQPWSRATPKGATTGAGYLTLTNKGSAPDRLLGGSVSFAKAVEVHTMSMDGNVMKMRQLKDGLVIPPGATVELKPQSEHLMIVGLKRPLEQGTSFKATLTFEKAGAVDVDFAVVGIGAPAPSGATAGSSKMMPAHGGAAAH